MKSVLDAAIEQRRERLARQDALYADEPWAKLATAAGYRPYDTESSARDAFRYCAARIIALEAALDLALILLGKGEPGDSRAVSDEFVAMAAIKCNLNDQTESLEIIAKAREREK